jgi:hypothetical protein
LMTCLQHQICWSDQKVQACPQFGHITTIGKTPWLLRKGQALSFFSKKHAMRW